MAASGNDDTDRIDAAFNRVLASEAQSRTRLEECRAAAARLTATAEARSCAIAERADRRVRLAHLVADAGVARCLSELAGDLQSRSPDDDSPALPDGLERAIALLADEILGASPGPGQ